MRIIALALAFLLLPSWTAHAQDMSLPQWTIDPAQSSLIFEATQQGAPFQGKFTDFSGTIWFDPMRPKASHGAIRIMTGSADTDSDDRDRYLMEESWFSSVKYPSATYTIDSFEKVATDQYVAHGKLTIRDISSPLNLPFTIRFETSSAGPAIVRVEGATKLKRLDFGVGQGEWKDTAMVANDVAIKVSVVAAKK